MKTLLYIPLMLVGMLLATTLSAQEDKCPLRPFEFDPNIVQRDVPNPELDTTDIPLGKKSNKLKNIYWIHGMAGGEGSWSKAVSYTEWEYGQYVQNIKINYGDSYYDIADVAANSLSYFGDKQPVGDTALAEEMKRDYIIAHSLGGLVARQFDLYYNTKNQFIKPFGGIVTFGTPHLGAHLAHIKKNEEHVIDHFIKTTCSDLLAGPVKDTILQNKIAKVVDNLLVSVDGGEWLTNELCDWITKLGIELAEEEFSLPIANSLVPGNEKLVEIANTPYPGEELHSIAFYGEEHDEKDDMAIRFLFGIKYNALSYPSMQADAMDDDALATAQELRQYYEEKYEYYKSKNVNNQNWMIPLAPIFGIPINYYINGINKDYRQAESAFYRGLRWFDLLNARWKILIGARTIIHDVETNCRCECEQKNNSNNPYEIKKIIPVDCNNPKICKEYAEDLDAKCLFASDFIDVFVDEPSDGLVTKSTAMALPNAKYKPVKMDGSGHFQMRNDSKLKQELEFIYGGIYNDYFNLTK